MPESSPAPAAEEADALIVATPEERRRAAVRGLLVVLTAFLLYRLGLGLIRPGTLSGGVVFALILVSAGGAIGLPAILLACLARALPEASRPRAIAALGLLAAGLALWLALALGGFGRIEQTRVIVSALADLGKIVAAGGFGLLLATAIREPNILMPAGLFAAFADFVVVNFGTVHHALQSESGRKLITAVSAQVPDVSPGFSGLSIGPADFLFLGVFLACAARFGMGLARNVVLLSSVLAASLIAVPLVGPVPALAPMSIAFVAGNWRHFRLSRQEVIGTTVVLLLAGAAFFAYFAIAWPRK